MVVRPQHTVTAWAKIHSKWYKRKTQKRYADNAVAGLSRHQPEKKVNRPDTVRNHETNYRCYTCSCKNTTVVMVLEEYLPRQNFLCIVWKEDCLSFAINVKKRYSKIFIGNHCLKITLPPFHYKSMKIAINSTSFSKLQTKCGKVCPQSRFIFTLSPHPHQIFTSEKARNNCSKMIRLNVRLSATTIVCS